MADECRVFLSTLPAGRGERRLALAVVLVSVVIFLTAAPFAKVKLAPVAAFIPIYESILVVTDLITAVLLFGQFSFLRSRALLVLATGYLFTALITVAHALTFPGLFAPTGLLGAGPQSTAWLYMFWHGGFPLLVIAYAWLKDGRTETSGPRGRPVVPLLGSVAAVAVVVSGVTLLATTGQAWLPPIMRGNQYTPVMILVVSSTWALSLIALIVLWRRRPHSVLDLWLMVVMCAWIFDIALAAVLNAGRFDLGFYAGRIYGLLAASFVLMVLLIENGRLYARLVGSHAELATEVAERRAAEAAADAANRAKSEFLSRMSHELRTPLNAILGFGQLLEMGGDGNRDPESVQHILKAGRHLLALINEVLDIARIEAGRLSVSLEPVIAGEVITATLDLMRPQAAARRVQLPATVPAADVYVMADRQRLQQVLLNLLSNAVKYNTEGGTVALSCLTEPGSARVRIAIRDTGRGIPPEMLARLFTPFDRLDADSTAIEGTGLGLALSKRLVEAMGGTIAVDSRVGEGTTFSVDVAAAEAPAAAYEALANPREAATAPRATRGKILYVEDNVANIQLLQRIVSRRPGVSLMASMQGLSAIDLARAHGPGLILLDLHLPDIPGDEVLARLLKDPETRDIPVVILSADATPARIERLLAQGARAYLTKPFDVAELLALFDTTLSN
jgi:signal transduction histidine kinase/ActR/RegA family two-component response regulator